MKILGTSLITALGAVMGAADERPMPRRATRRRPVLIHRNNNMLSVSPRLLDKALDRFRYRIAPPTNHECVVATIYACMLAGREQQKAKRKRKIARASRRRNLRGAA